MPFTLFTIIQADDDALGPAADYLEQTFNNSRPQQDASLMPRETARSTSAHGPDSSPADTFYPDNNKEDDLPEDQLLPLRTTLRPDQSNPDHTRPISWSENSTLGKSRLPGHRQPAPRSRSPRAVSISVPSRSMNSSPVPMQGAALTAVPMARAQSLPPSSSTSSHLSSVRSSPRTRSPFRSDDSTYDAGFEIIAEDSELELSQQRQPFDRYNLLPNQIYSTKSARALAGRRQRPTSPLHSTASTPLSSSASSPALSTLRYNEAFPTLHHFASTSSFSSFASTPTSTRSRSPSISSLDTIEDAPDLESEAIEKDKLARLKAAALDAANEREAADQAACGRPRTASLETQKAGVGLGFGRSNQRKRWSVCGAERRADLDLETIWED